MEFTNEFIVRGGLFDMIVVRLQSTRCTQGTVAELQAWTCDGASPVVSWETIARVASL